MQTGDFRTRHSRNHLASPSSGQPPGTLSQEVYYIDPQTNVEMARVHQFVRSDGTLGGSGKPDPKRLFVDGTLYRLRKGAPVEKDPSLRYSGILRWCYLRWRRIKCLLLGR